ncbi:uncharacterized protein LOC108273236 [Ictalurus punctatus]|uniref:Uncharacterized protein LOC108273236 n=1 Tax=Ictalurus punctatus TaxID=7998 RepID=A0A2D0S531_ICTPU|nr:uncharacterized protein LOC108273236 [Ictalurus punctatus]
MEFHSSEEVNTQWKPPLDYTTNTTTISKSVTQRVSESSSHTEASDTDGFLPCQSKSLVDNEEFSSTETNNEQDSRNAYGPFSRLHNIYSSEDSDEDVCASRLRKTKSILDELFTDESNDSASDSGEDLPSKPGDESDGSSSDISECPRPSASTHRGSKVDGVAVNKTEKTEDGRRVYNKKHYCLFCSKPFSKIARHLEDIHSKEEEVSKACSFPKGSKQRRIYLDELRLRGNYIHNIAVLKSGKGDLIPYKRPRGEMKASDFMHCPHCQGLFTKKVLWRHMKVCKLSPKDYVPKPGKNRALSLCAATQPVPRNISPELWKILSVMVSDEITEAVKNDSCIIQMAEHWLRKSGESPNSQCFIRQKLRELGKLLLSGRKVTSLRKLEDFIDPYNCMQAVEAVRHACEYNSEKNTYKIPSLAKKLAICLAQLSRLIRTKVVMPKNVKLARKLQNFQKIHEERWNDLLCATVLRNSEDEEVKFKPPTLLAFTEDVQKLHAFLDKAQDEFTAQLSAESSTKHWSDLAKVALTQIILFNRSREAEVVSMTLETFLSRDNTDPATDIDWALTEVEKQLCRHFYKIIIRRDGARPIPILLTLKMLRALQLLVEKRESCGVMKDNTYVFARPSASSHFRCSDCVRGFALICGAKDPQALTCWKLRKRMATLSTVLNLGDPEINQLASFLGHELIIQDEFYPLHERTLQLAKVHKVLTAMEQGRMMEFMGKNFSDIDVQPEEKVDLSSDKVKNSWECSGVFPGTCPGKKAAQKKRKPWSGPEIQAVEKHMKDYITSCRVPGKAACENCLSAEPLMLKKRDWQSVKFYIYNRIMAQKRDASHKV